MGKVVDVLNAVPSSKGTPVLVIEAGALCVAIGGEPAARMVHLLNKKVTVAVEIDDGKERPKPPFVRRWDATAIGPHAKRKKGDPILYYGKFIREEEHDRVVNQLIEGSI